MRGEKGLRRARTSVVLACVGSIVGSALSAATILAGDSVGAGPVALLAGGLLVIAAAGRPFDRRPAIERILIGLTDRMFDGAILAALVWTSRASEPTLAGAALACFAFGSLAAYARARALGLGYGVEFLSQISVIKVGGVGLTLLLGWGTAGLLSVTAWLLVSTLVRVSQVYKESLA